MSENTQENLGRVVSEGEEHSSPRPEELNLAILPRIVTRPMLENPDDISGWLLDFLTQTQE